jgi:hypothetical protein
MATFLICIALYALGGLIVTVGGIWLLVAAFRVSVIWGLGSLFVPFISLAFVITHWPEAKRPFLVQLVGCLIVVAGLGLGFATLGQLAAMVPQPTQASATETPASGPPPLVETIRQVLSSLRSSTASTVGRSEDNTPHRFIGQPIQMVEQTLGRPKGRMTIRGRVGLLYDGFTLLSENGRTITSVAVGPDYQMTPDGDTADASANSNAAVTP